jgi:hypothetical protein
VKRDEFLVDLYPNDAYYPKYDSRSDALRQRVYIGLKDIFQGITYKNRLLAIPALIGLDCSILQQEKQLEMTGLTYSYFHRDFLVGPNRQLSDSSIG